MLCRGCLDALRRSPEVSGASWNSRSCPSFPALHGAPLQNAPVITTWLWPWLWLACDCSE
eukprot:6795990-Alexandrium_andersonii.AAC.1